MQFKNSNFTASIGEYYVVDTTAGNVLCNLPDTTSWGDDNTINFLLYPSGEFETFTINAYDTQKINGDTTLVLNSESTIKNIVLVMGNNDWYTF